MPVTPPQQQLHPRSDAFDRQDNGFSLKAHVSFEAASSSKKTFINAGLLFF